MNCNECGAAFAVQPQAEDQHIRCRCGATTFRGLRRRPPSDAPMSVLAKAEPRMRGELALARALDTVRPTTELLEHCYDTLRKHGIVWHR
jgi:hypothetical protein